MESTVDVTGQDVDGSGNTIIYRHILKYNSEYNTIPPPGLVALPYEDEVANAAYRVSLQSNVKGFENLSHSIGGRQR